MTNDTCARWQRAIALWASGDLPEARIKALEAHMEACAPCRAYAEEMRGCLADLRRLRQAPAPDELRMALRQRLGVAQADPSPRSSEASLARWRLAHVATWAATVLAVLAVGAMALLWRMERAQAPASGQESEATVAQLDPALPSAPGPAQCESAAAAQAPEAPAAPIVTQAGTDSANPKTNSPNPPTDSRNPRPVIKLYTDNPRVVIFVVPDVTEEDATHDA